MIYENFIRMHFARFQNDNYHTGKVIAGAGYYGDSRADSGSQVNRWDI